MRLDKFLANMGIGTRNEVKQSLKKGYVKVNDKVNKSPKTQINPDEDIITVNGEKIIYIDKVYIMLNKPSDVVSATEDDKHQTVIDLIPEYKHLGIFPVGRLDKDTEGLLLITNDGQFNHNLMSSKNDVTQSDVERFKEGLELSDGLLKPAQLEIIENRRSRVTIYEGKYHQVKRMFHEIENEVLQLKRIKIANLELDTSLKLGEFRLLTEEDFKLLLN